MNSMLEKWRNIHECFPVTAIRKQSRVYLKFICLPETLIRQNILVCSQNGLLMTNTPSFVEKCLPIPGFGDHDTTILVHSACQLKYSKQLHRSKY